MVSGLRREVVAVSVFIVAKWLVFGQVATVGLATSADHVSLGSVLRSRSDGYTSWKLVDHAMNWFVD